MIVKDGKVLILADRIGLSPDATPEQIVARLTELVAQAGQTERWRKEAEENAKLLSDKQKVETQLKEVEADLIVREAVSSFKIDAHEAPRFKTLLLKDKPFAMAWLDEKRTNEYLKRKASLTGETSDPVDPLVELEGRVAEKRAKDATLSIGAAQEMVFKESPDLYERYVAARGKGGER